MKWPRQCWKWSKAKSVSTTATRRKSSQLPTCVATKCQGSGSTTKKQCGSPRRNWRRGPATSSRRASRGRCDSPAAWAGRVKQSMKATIQYLLTSTSTNQGRSGSKMRRSCSPTSSPTRKTCKGVSDSLKLSTCAIIYCSKTCRN